MRFWFSHSGEVTLREQLIAQVMLGVASGDLPHGARLPSTRVLARRCGLHANTVSAAYRELQGRDTVERRHGSGVYVRELPAEASAATLGEMLVAKMVASAREMGVPLPVLQECLMRRTASQARPRWLLLESDAALAKIVRRELQEGLEEEVVVAPLETAASLQADGTVVLVLPSKLESVRSAVAAPIEVVGLQISAVPPPLAHWMAKRPPDALVGIASGWPGFLAVGRTMLVAAGVSAECLLARSTEEPNWTRGLEQTAGVVCDVTTMTRLSQGCVPVVYRIVSESSLQELRERVRETAARRKD